MILSHTITLYFGSLAAAAARVYDNMVMHRDARNDARTKNDRVGLAHRFVAAARAEIYEPLLNATLVARLDSSYRWSMYRDLIIAPLSEEIVFRGCLCAPLLSTGMSPTAVAWTAPIFFGTAHLHHAFLKLQHTDGSASSRNAVIAGTALQFSYTTLFGAYCAHSFMRTGSLLAVFLSHMFCNFMGLPDASFLSSSSRLNKYYWFVGTAYLLGIVAFAVGFHDGSIFFPKRGVISTLFAEP